MRAWIFSIVLLVAWSWPQAAGAQLSPSGKNLFRIEHATSEILQQVNQAGVDVAMVRGLGSAKDWQPRGMAEIDLWLSADELRGLQGIGIHPVPLRDEAREMWLQEQTRPDREYHNYTALTSLMQAYAAAYPSICRLFSIGQSVQGRELWVLKITDNPDLAEDEPEFKYVGTMHGNEPVGCEMLVYLMDYLLVNYGSLARVTDLVDGMEINILPLMNPDGNTAGNRTNANGVDLNRNFPDPFVSPNNTPAGRQPETAAMMTWTQDKDFNLSANFHTGALVVNYPYDNNASGASVYTASPDDGLFIQVSEAYSTHNFPMYSGAFTHGITNGAEWYAISGGMQDWNYRYEGGNEVTIELSDTYWPDASLLPGLWNDNRESLLSYMEWAWRGVRGIVTSAVTGLPLAGVEVRVTGRDVATWSAATVGDYHRLLPAGIFTLTFNKAGYQTTTLSNVMVGTGVATVRDVSLQPIVAAPDLALGTVTVLDGGNGRLDPGESTTLQVQLQNVGTTNATALQGLLSETSPYVTVTSGAQAYGDLAPDQLASASYNVTVAAEAPSGETVNFSLEGSCTEISETLPFALSVGLVAEDFETGNFLAWPWTQGGTLPWQVVTTLPFEGAYCARSGAISHSQSSLMSMNLNFLSAGVVQFQAKVSSEANYDFLRFAIDGVVQISLSGTVAWSQYSFPVSAGVHLLSWTYEKDVNTVGGSDTAWVDWILLPPVAPTPHPDVAVAPLAVQATLSPGGNGVEQLTVSNNGAADLIWTAQLSLDNRTAQGLPDLKLPKGVEDPRSEGPERNAGGPDAYGYTWADSREISGGPVYSWVEINALGTALVAADDVNYGPFNLGFVMPYYGNSYSTVRISTNGFLSFTATESAYANAGMPNGAAPNNMVAPFWDDLDPTRGGTIYYWDDPAADRFVVEYNAVRHYTGTATETFQVILSGDGGILYQYRTMSSTTNSCTVGIENAAGTDGLQVLFNTGGWLVNNLALRFTPPILVAPWAVLSPLSGTVAAGGSAILDLALSAADLVEGTYTGSLLLTCNDPDTPSLTVPLTLTVLSQLSPVTDLHISAAAGQVTLNWSAVPNATEYRVYQAQAPYGVYTWVGTTVALNWTEALTADGEMMYQVTAARP